MSRAETSRQLLALIVLNPGKTVTGLSRRSGLPPKMLHRLLASMVHKRKVRVVNLLEPKAGVPVARYWAMGA